MPSVTSPGGSAEPKPMAAATRSCPSRAGTRTAATSAPARWTARSTARRSAWSAPDSGSAGGGPLLALQGAQVLDDLPALGFGQGRPRGHRTAARRDLPEEAAIRLRLHGGRRPVGRLRVQRGRAGPVALPRLAVAGRAR